MSPPPRARRAAPWLLAALLLIPLAWRTSQRSNEGDLRVYYDTVSRLSAGLDLYQHREGPDPERPTGYIYPPLFALGFWPLTLLPFPLVRGLWFFGMALLALRAYRVAWGLAGGGRDPSPRGRALLALGVLATLRFAWSDLGHGQANLLVLWLALEGVAQAEAGRERAAGAFLALAVLVKLTPAILLAGYLLERRWRLIGTAAAVGALGLLAPVPILGLTETADGLWRFVTTITAWNARYHAYVGNNAALTAWLQRVLVGVADAGHDPRRLLLAFDPDAVRLACSGVSAGVLLGALVLSRRLAAGVPRAAFLFAAIPLVSPIAWKPHLVCLVLPALVAARGLGRPGGRRLLLGLGLALCLLTARALIGRELATLALLWGVLTLGLVLLALGLALPEAVPATPEAEGDPG